jgi:glycosyltransferase involved in cell wall biosynthesis
VYSFVKPNPINMPKISVVICTHNRDSYLGSALDTILNQEFDDFDVVVVDNASTDRTREVVESRMPHPRLRYVYEGTLGLNVARNRGIQETTSPIIAYFDDDALAPPQWLSCLDSAYQTYPKLGVAGGKVTLIWPEGFTQPNWLSPTLIDALGAYELGDEIVFIKNAGQTPRGLNYSIRRSVLEEVGDFKLNLDRVGKNLLSHGELYMTELVLRQGWQVAYLPEAIVGHQVSVERTKAGWYLRRGWWQGISECNREQLEGRAGAAQIRRGSENLLRGLYKSLKFFGDPAQRFENFVYAYGQIGYMGAAISGMLKSPSTPDQAQG